MKITFKGDYAIKSLVFLSRYYEEGGGRYFQLSEISKDQDIPEKFLEQIFLILRKAGYLKSHRGAKGGFALNRNPGAFTLGEIARLIEGPLSPIACVSHSSRQACDFERRCVLRPLWAEVRDAVSGIIDRVTFRDLAERERKLLREQAEPPMYYI
ncbi:MAG: Rrf2 family transcriptional regulator [Spirochaetales bacterium]|nr:Rrf2 family transcriptional regulator [Spirochaetales bacterium]